MKLLLKCPKCGGTRIMNTKAKDLSKVYAECFHCGKRFRIHHNSNSTNILKLIDL